MTTENKEDEVLYTPTPDEEIINFLIQKKIEAENAGDQANVNYFTDLIEKARNRNDKKFDRSPLQWALQKVEDLEIKYSYENRGNFPSGMLLKESVTELLQELEVALTKNQR